MGALWYDPLMAKQSPPPIGIAPVLMVSDIYASVAWYTDKLGFSVEQIWGDPPSFAIAEHGSTSIMLKQSANGSCRNDTSLAGMWDIYLWVSDIDKVKSLLTSGNVSILRGPTKQPYGCTEIELNDPDGHVIAFGYCP